MLELVRDRERGASEIAELTGLTRPATSQHLRVLRDADLVRVRVAGNQRLYRSDDVRLDELRAALDAFWGHRVYAAVRPLHDDSWAKFLPQLATAAEGSRP
jgi:DNA-binding transcriptional ArsR family regulator